MRWMLLVSLVALCGCTDAAISKFQSIGAPHKVELYSGGQKVREWVSTGKVLNEDNSDGFYFCDKDTNVVVRVTGDLVITPIGK